MRNDGGGHRGASVRSCGTFLEPRTVIHMRLSTLVPTVILIVLTVVHETVAQQAGVERLPANVLDVRPPSARVHGATGEMTIRHDRAALCLRGKYDGESLISRYKNGVSSDSASSIARASSRALQRRARLRATVMCRLTCRQTCAAAEDAGFGCLQKKRRVSRRRSPGIGRSPPKDPGLSRDRMTSGRDRMARPRDGTPRGPRRSSPG